MIENKLLTTADIENMPLKQFLKYKVDLSERKLITAEELLCANEDWILINELEHVKTLKELFYIIRQVKEDLWFDVQRRKRG